MEEGRHVSGALPGEASVERKDRINRLDGWTSNVLEKKRCRKRSLLSKTVFCLKSLHLSVFGRKGKVKVRVG